ncbi:MAG: hypothetical protein AAFO04_26375 [Cyanobacteria bacterium J06592_8]
MIKIHYIIPITKEKGVEGIIIFPKTVGNTVTPMQAATRQWDYETRQLKFDLIGRAVINISFWFATPVSSNLLAGLQGELSIIIVSLSATVTGVVPTGTSLAKTVGGLPWPAVINTLSVSLLGPGLGAGASIITGSQDVTLKASLTSLSVINLATNTAVMKVGEPATLKVTLYYPYAGGGPVIILNNNGTTITTFEFDTVSRCKLFLTTSQ